MGEKRAKLLKELFLLGRNYSMKFQYCLNLFTAFSFEAI